MLIFTALACAPQLAPTSSRDTGAVDTQPEETVDSEGLVVSTMGIDASDYESWVFFDLDTASITPDEESTAWDIAIQRYHLALSGGVIGAGSVTAAVVTDIPFDDLTVAPASGYTTDAPDADDDGVPEHVLAGWYDYDSETHILTPADIAYVIQTDVGPHRLEVLDYYNDAGTSGHLTFRWGAIHTPNPE